jgi:hypothetical protein
MVGYHWCDGGAGGEASAPGKRRVRLRQERKERKESATWWVATILVIWVILMEGGLP